MNIDLLVTQQGDAGLVCDAGFDSPVAGVLFDAETREVTLEYANLETTHLNIPVEDDIAEMLLWAMSVQVGVIAQNQVQDNRQVPLMLLNDPDGMPGRELPMKASNSVVAFERFLKACVTGQPLHRDDLGNEDDSGSVMGGMNRAVLQFAPHLARQRTLEATHDLNMSGPAAPGMGMGGGGGGGAPPLRQRSTGQGRTNPQQTRPTDKEDD
ncbi:MAG: hypothetical protein H6867_01265 [Rhodospirillales bacterium]|nr:hypothetical protein [Rhodospirillales bacterium]MCB9997145.1 hypothetical protein [Rhodospirillales bacterium]